MKKIGLTGANGFIGNIIKRGLEEDGHIICPLRSDELNNYYTLDALIHCARKHKNISDNGKDLLKNPNRSQWISEMETDVYLPHKLTIDMVRQNINLKNIIFISSIYGRIPPSVRHIPLNYVCMKAAEIYLAKNLAIKLAPIRVNTVLLGGVRSDRKEANQTDDFLNRYTKKTLLKKMTDEDEVIEAVRYLLKDNGMTGAEIEVSGGYGLDEN